ncbi:tail fiber domain-containing protein [Flavobacteriales bacterium]|nr:tail fiber domain-containing protein [Flavobacteriales bacterium]
MQSAVAQNVGINGDGSTPESNTMLDIKSTGNTSVTYGLKVKDSGANDQFVVRSDGNVGIGTNSPGANLDVTRSNSATPFAVSNFAIGDMFVIKGNNLVGIQTTTPEQELHIKHGDDGHVIMIMERRDANDGSNIIFRSGSTINYRLGTIGDATSKFHIGNGSVRFMTITPSGDMGIGTTTPAFKLDVNGTTACTGNVWTSDERKKKYIAPYNASGLDIINQLKPVTFQWKEVLDDGMKGTQTGFIAQELEKIVPNMVVTANDSLGSKAVKYNELFPVLVNAIKEQQAIIEKQQQNITLLRADNATLQQSSEKNKAFQMATNLRLKQLEELLNTSEK